MDGSTLSPNAANSGSGNQSMAESDEDPISVEQASRKRQRSQDIGHNMPLGQKMIVRTNYLNQPCENHPVTVAFQTKVGIIARRDIPICHMDWRDVDPNIIEDAIKCLGVYFEFDYQESLDTYYTRKKLNSAWKTFKSDLFKKYVQDEDPSMLRATVPDDLAIPLEDWQVFVYNCNTAAYKASSERNTKNRDKLLNPSYTGRRLGVVVRHMMAIERGIPDSEISRSESYMAMHTTKNKIPQCPELFERLNNHMTIDPKSRVTGVNDALAQETRPDSRGNFRGMGTGVCKTQLRMMEPYLKKNSKLLERNSELENSIANMDAKIEAQNAEVAELRSMVLRQGRAPMPHVASPHSDTFGQTHVDDNAFLGKECELRTGLPLKTIANAIVQAVDPHLEFGNRRLEEGNFKVFVAVVHDQNIVLPCPHDEYCTTLGQLGQGSIIWPREALRFKH